MNKVLAIYNICGISGKENVDYYIGAINSILNQDFLDMHVLVSGCLTSNTTKEILQDAFANNVSFNWIDQKYPLGITFNHAIQQGVNHHGLFESYLYIDSGVTFGTNKHVVKILYELLNSGTFGMVATQVDIDNGYDAWRINWDCTSDYIMPLGKTTNLHCQLFSRKLYESYNNKVFPDIFAHDTSESIYVYMCAAIKLKFVISSKLLLHHKWSMDGGSIGYRARHPLLINSPKNIYALCNEGRYYGFGYEECNGVCKHDPDKFDSNGYALDERLYHFIKNNMFIQENIFSYKQIVSKFINSKKTTPMTIITSPKMTCILVSHNKPDYVKEAIASLLNQTMPDWQGILIDSGVLYDKGFFNYLHDERLQIIRSNETSQLQQSKAMAPYCFNICLKNFTKGFLVMYLCDDDILYPNAFATFVDYWSEHPYASCMYASQDMAVHESNGNRLMVGERRALVKRGKVVNGPLLDCQVDYLQFCHRFDILQKFNIYWSEDKATESHADGVFMETLGSYEPIYPIDVKVSQNRRTPQSTYAPS